MDGILLTIGYIEESVSRIDTACHSGESSSALGQSTSTSQDAPGTNNETNIQGESTPGYKLGGATGQSHDQVETEKPNVDEMRQKRLAFLNRIDSGKDSSEQKPDGDTTEKCSCDNGSNVTINGTKSETESSGKNVIC